MPHNWASRQRGRGPDLLLLHGWGTQGSIFSELMSRLEPAFRVTALDLPGHGRTPCGDGLTLDVALAGLRASIAHLDLRRPALLGWSLGASLALAYAARYPDAVSKLVLIAATPRFVRAADWAHGMEPAVFDDFAQGLLRAPAETLKRFFALQTLDDGEGRLSLHRIRHAVLDPLPDLRCLQGGLAMLQSVDLRARLAAVSQPVLVMHGARDRIASPAAGRHLAHGLPHGSLIEFSRGGHAPFLSAPAACAEAIKDFLSGGSPPEHAP